MSSFLGIFFGEGGGGVGECFRSLQIVMKLIPRQLTEVCYLIELLMDTNSVPSTSVDGQFTKKVTAISLFREVSK